MTTFTAAIEKFVRIAEGRADETVRRIALGILANVVVASPVDTGRFRGNWQVGLGSRSTDTGSEDKGGGDTISRGQRALETFKAGGVVYLSNSLPYAMALEYGHSQQAPRGMVRVTFSRLKDIVEEASR